MAIWSGEDKQTVVRSIIEGKAVDTPRLPGDHGYKKQIQAAVEAFVGVCGPSKLQKEKSAQEAVSAIKDAKLEQDILQRRQRLLRMDAAKWIGVPHTCPSVAAAFQPSAVCPPSWIEKEAQSWGSAEQLSEKWRQAHRGIQDEPAKFLDPGIQRRPCWTNHHCHCKGSGLLLRILHTRFRQSTQRMCADVQFQRSMIAGRVVVIWQIVSGEQVLSNVTQIALHYLRPWRPTFLVLEAADSETQAFLSRVPDDDMVPAAALLAQSMRLKATCTKDGCLHTVSCWHWLGKLDLAAKIRVRFCMLSDRHKPIASLTTFVADLVEAGGTVIWAGQAHERRPRQPAAPREALAVLEAWHSSSLAQQK